MSKILGGCLCGAIRYEAEVETILTLRCHCRDCQYISGGEPAAVLAVPSSGLRCVQGAPRIFWSTAESGNRVFRSFCANCGTPLFAGNESNPEITVIKLGSLDEPSKYAPRVHLWTSSAQPWHHIESTAITFPRNPSS